MRLEGLVFALCSSLSACDGTDTNSEGESSGAPSSTTSSEPQEPICELESRVALADQDELAPNGQSGSKIVAAIPTVLQTSLHWDFSSPNSGVEVEVPGSSGLSTSLELSFSLPPEPEFFFEDWSATETKGDVLIECLDVVTTAVDLALVTGDGTIMAQLSGLIVRLGPDRPEEQVVARPFVYEVVETTTPKVNFLEPEPLSATTDKTLSMEFDEQLVEGVLTVHAQGSANDYRHAVARW